MASRLFSRAVTAFARYGPTTTAMARQTATRGYASSSSSAPASRVTAQELDETRSELLELGCTPGQIKVYLEWGQKEYLKLSPSVLNTTAYLEQLPTAMQILDGTILSELPESEHSKLRLAARSVFRGAARDLNKDGHVSFKEFVMWAAMEGKARRGDVRGRLNVAFRLMDQDGSGYISMDELVSWIKIGVNLGVVPSDLVNEMTPEEIARSYMGKYDRNNDDRISFDEFVELGVLLDLDQLFMKNPPTKNADGAKKVSVANKQDAE